MINNLKPVPAAFGTAANPGCGSKETRDRHSALDHKPNAWQNKMFLPILGDCRFESLTLFFWLRLLVVLLTVSSSPLDYLVYGLGCLTISAQKD
jgi:hypothetical protein